MNDYRTRRLVAQQVTHYFNSCPFYLGRPEWYETKRKTTHVVFWS